ncbi:MAG: sulfotransferase [Granulosicoccus sp.]
MNLQYDDEISNGDITPVILLGAPRSGTQMYRDMICSHSSVATWPYNEMTYMWRYGNRTYPTEEIPAELLTRKIASYIRGCFIKLSKRTGSPIIVDKTCNNCLRPDYVSAVFPEAKYIYLIRHAMDVVPSTVKRATGSPPAGEYKKVFSIPKGDILYHALRVIWNHGGLLRPGNSKVRAWGPRFEGMDTLLKTKSLEEVSAHQWLRLTEVTDNYLNSPAFDSPLLRVRYEEITKDPDNALREVFTFLGIDTPDEILSEWRGKVRYQECGASARKLGTFQSAVQEIVAAKNAEHGYSAVPTVPAQLPANRLGANMALQTSTASQVER